MDFLNLVVPWLFGATSVLYIVTSVCMGYLYRRQDSLPSGVFGPLFTSLQSARVYLLLGAACSGLGLLLG